MSEFFEHKLDLEPKYFQKLIKGKAHTVKVGQIGSGLTVRLGPANHKKMMMGYNKKKNKVLKLTKEEIDHNMSENMVEGSGFFKTLNKIGISRKQFMKGTKTISKIAAPVLNTIGKTVIPELATAIAVETGIPPPLVSIALNKGLDAGTNRLDEYGQTGKGMAYQASEFYPNLTKGKGLESDIKKGFNKGINYIKGGSVSIRPVVYNDDGFKPAVNHFSRVIQGSGIESNDVNHNSIYVNGYMNNKIPLGHQIYKPYVEGGLIYNPNNDPKISARNEALKEHWKQITLLKNGGSFKPSGY